MRWSTGRPEDNLGYHSEGPTHLLSWGFLPAGKDGLALDCLSTKPQGLTHAHAPGTGFSAQLHTWLLKVHFEYHTRWIY